MSFSKRCLIILILTFSGFCLHSQNGAPGVSNHEDIEGSGIGLIVFDSQVHHSQPANVQPGLLNSGNADPPVHQPSKVASHHTRLNPPGHALGPIGYGIYILLALSGVYVTIFGFRVFRLMMIMLGFYVSYYGILFLTTEFGVYQANNAVHQLGLFFGCILLGFVISILCYMLDKANFLIFGMAVASVIALFTMQFLFDVHDPDGKIYLVVIYGTSTFVFAVLAFFLLDHFIIWGSAFVGAIITPINVGVVFKDFRPFEERQVIDLDHWQDLRKYLLICGLMLITGIGVQYYLRRRIIKRMEESNLEEIRGTSFLN